MKRVVGYLYYVISIAGVPLACMFSNYLEAMVNRTFQPFPFAYLFYLVVFAFGVYLFLGRFLGLSEKEWVLCKAVTIVVMFLFAMPSLLLPFTITNIVATSKLYILPFLIVGYLLPSMIFDIVKIIKDKKYHVD